jgi:hypothetical protein
MGCDKNRKAVILKRSIGTLRPANLLNAARAGEKSAVGEFFPMD